jgi:hypothetical protein
MAFFAAIHLKVGGVLEDDVADIFVLEGNVHSPGMAGDAVAGNAECLLAVVASSAGPAFLHLFHTDGSAAFITPFEDFRVTFTTFNAMRAMLGMVEDDLADGSGPQFDFDHHTYGVQNRRQGKDQQNDY